MSSHKVYVQLPKPYGGFLSHRTSKQQVFRPVLVLKPMVTCGSPHFRKPPYNDIIYVSIFLYIYIPSVNLTQLWDRTLAIFNSYIIYKRDGFIHFPQLMSNNQRVKNKKLGELGIQSHQVRSPPAIEGNGDHFSIGQPHICGWSVCSMKSCNLRCRITINGCI